jgi:hypothetical protein
MAKDTGFQVSTLNLTNSAYTLQRYWNLKKWSRNNGNLSYSEDYNEAARRLGTDTPDQEIYWRQLAKLDANVTYSATYGQNSTKGERDLDHYRTGRPAWVAGLNLFNKYAGYAGRPASSPGAWIVFMYQDAAGSYPAINNLGFFITQNHPQSTSQHTRQSGYQGFWARKFTAPNTNFTLDPGFTSAIKGTTVDVNVTYIPSSGTWQLQASQNGNLQTIGTSSGSSSSWTTTTFTLANTQIPGNTPADLRLNVTKGQPILHLIEITKNSNAGSGTNSTQSLSSPKSLLASWLTNQSDQTADNLFNSLDWLNLYLN